MILPIPLVGVHKSPQVDYIVKKLAGNFSYALSLEKNYSYQDEITHKERSTGNLLTLQKRYVTAPPVALDEPRETFHDLIKPHLPEIREHLVNLQKTLDDLSNDKDLKDILVEQLQDQKISGFEIERLFFTLANEAALNDEIFTSLLPVRETIEKYNPVELLYLISDTIRKIRRERNAFYLGGQNQSLNKHPRL